MISIGHYTTVSLDTPFIYVKKIEEDIIAKEIGILDIADSLKRIPKHADPKKTANFNDRELINLFIERNYDKNFVLFDKNYTDKFTRATKESMSLRSITICSHGYSLDIIHGFKFTEELFEEKEFKIKPVEHYNLKWIDYRTNSPRKIVTYGSQGPNWSSKGYSIDHTIHNSHHDDTESGIFHLSDILLEVMVLAASVYEYVKDNNELNIHSYYLHDSLKLTLSRMTDEYFTDADLGKNYVNKMKAVKNIQENLDWRNVLDKNIVDSISKSEQIYERFNHVKSRIKR